MSETPEQILDGYRQRIDAIDDQLIALLKERIGIVAQVASLKRREWPKDCHIRSGREGRMHQRIAQTFTDSDFPPRAALAIWREIIGASTNLESPLKIITAGAAYASMAQAYFGSMAQVAHSESAHAALSAMASRHYTIMVVGRESLSIIAAHAPQLKIFAALPLVCDTPEAFALAAIDPEPSGNDTSYFWEQGTLVTLPSFVSSKPGAQWLGTHPAQIRL